MGLVLGVQRDTDGSSLLEGDFAGALQGVVVVVIELGVGLEEIGDTSRVRQPVVGLVDGHPVSNPISKVGHDDLAVVGEIIVEIVELEASVGEGLERVIVSARGDMASVLEQCEGSIDVQECDHGMDAEADGIVDEGVVVSKPRCVYWAASGDKGHDASPGDGE